VEKATRLCRKYVDELLRWRGLGALEIRYEDLHADTAGRLRRLFDALGLESSGVEELVNRFRQGAELPIPGVFRRGCPGDWRRSLTPEEAAVVQREMDEYLDALGYR